MITAVLQIFAMLISVAIARSNNFHANFGALFGLWTMRPRMSIASLIWAALTSHWDIPESVTSHWNVPKSVKRSPYYWTAKDAILADCILNVLSMPFAIHFLNGRGAAAEQCAVQFLDNTNVGTFYRPLVLIVFLGALSLLLLSWQIVRHVAASKSEDESPTLFHPFALLCILNVVLSFIGNWVLWGGT